MFLYNYIQLKWSSIILHKVRTDYKQSVLSVNNNVCVCNILKVEFNVEGMTWKKIGMYVIWMNKDILKEWFYVTVVVAWEWMELCCLGMVVCTISVETTLALNCLGLGAKVAHVHLTPPNLPQHKAIHESLSLLPNCKKRIQTLTRISLITYRRTATISSIPLYCRYSLVLVSRQPVPSV
jgi:hypothetical protein